MPRAIAIPAAERRLHAVQALLELARDTAPEAISTAAIAERMGVSHGALFRHFPSREALWAEAVRWAVSELEERFERCAEAADPPGELKALMACQADFLQRHPGLVRLLFAELQRPGTSPARETGKAFMQRFRQRLAALISSAQAEGVLQPGMEPQELAALMVATQQGLMLQALAYDSFPQLAERSRQAIALLLMAGQGPAPPAGPAAAPAAPPAETAAPPAGTHRHRPEAPPAGRPGG
ncbi:MAG: TetR/AcrR family transcriptional regulator [Cyanobium sp.]